MRILERRKMNRIWPKRQRKESDRQDGGEQKHAKLAYRKKRAAIASIQVWCRNIIGKRGSYGSISSSPGPERGLNAGLEWSKNHRVKSASYGRLGWRGLAKLDAREQKAGGRERQRSSLGGVPKNAKQKYRCRKSFTADPQSEEKERKQPANNRQIGPKKKRKFEGRQKGKEPVTKPTWRPIPQHLRLQ